MKHERAWIALFILGLLLFGLMMADRTGINRVVVVWFCALAMIGTRCVSGARARAAINWQVLLTIGAAIGFGAASAARTLDHRRIGFLEVTSLMGDSRDWPSS